jgi:hypothetical protein
VELLHIDDVGAEKTSPWVIEQLYSIVNSRYEDGRAIMGTTNLEHPELREQIGDRTVSRIVEICGDPFRSSGKTTGCRWISSRPRPPRRSARDRCATGAGTFAVRRPDGEPSVARRLRG